MTGGAPGAPRGLAGLAAADVRVDPSDATDLAGRHVAVAILGAGFGGLGMAIRLAREGRDSFLVLERGEDVGGTWRDNTYPGVACDIPSHLYSYSFRPHPRWSRVFAPGAEILAYLRRAADEEGIGDRLRLRTEVLDAAWSPRLGRWEVRTSRGTCTADVLVVAAGRLSEPRTPDVAGLDSFPGPVVHSARWPRGLDLGGLRIGVVGTGASAVQLVPHLTRVAQRVVVFQRSAPWVLPREDRSYTEAEQQAFAADPSLGRELRASLLSESEAGFAARRGAPAELAALRARARDHLRHQVADPDLRARLTPDYEIGCKRVLFSQDYYPALTSDHVKLVPAASTGSGPVVTAADGSTHELDALVLATGFRAARPPFAERVHGRAGLSLAEHWSDGMTSYGSISVSGFPNMFVLNGPNATLGHGSAIDMLETQIDYVLGALDHLDVDGGGVLEVRSDAEAAYTREIDAMARSTVWLDGGCTSWYRDEASGRLTLIWPGTAAAFRERNGGFDRAPYAQEPVPGLRDRTASTTA